AEACRERFVVVRLEAERVPFARRPPRVDREQLGGGVADLLGGLALRLLPLPGAELVEGRLFRAHSGVARDQVELRDWNVERCLVGVLELEELARLLVGAAERDRRQPEVA